MDENFGSHPQDGQIDNQNNVADSHNPNENVDTSALDEKVIAMSRQDNTFNRLSMDDKGDIRQGYGGQAAVASTSKLYIVLGWVSAALTFLISPLFAIPGIIFGVLANRQVSGRGNVIIITNIVLAALGIIFGVIRSMIRY